MASELGLRGQHRRVHGGAGYSAEAGHQLGLLQVCAGYFVFQTRQARFFLNRTAFGAMPSATHMRSHEVLYPSSWYTITSGNKVELNATAALIERESTPRPYNYLECARTSSVENNPRRVFCFSFAGQCEQPKHRSIFFSNLLFSSAFDPTGGERV